MLSLTQKPWSRAVRGGAENLDGLLGEAMEVCSCFTCEEFVTMQHVVHGILAACEERHISPLALFGFPPRMHRTSASRYKFIGSSKAVYQNLP